MALKGLKEHAHGEQKHPGVPEVAPLGKEGVSPVLIGFLYEGLNDAAVPAGGAGF
jgi:hypothetical protein